MNGTESADGMFFCGRGVRAEVSAEFTLTSEDHSVKEIFSLLL